MVLQLNPQSYAVEPGMSRSSKARFPCASDLQTMATQEAMEDDVAARSLKKPCRKSFSTNKEVHHDIQ